MIIGKIYVDCEGLNKWFGLLGGFEKGSFNSTNNIWNWQVINSDIVIKGRRVNNYYNRREANEEELKQIKIILKKLGYELDKFFKLIDIGGEMKPVIELEEADKYNRTIKLGLEYNHYTTCFPIISVEELKNLRDEINKFLKENNYE